MPEIDYSTLQPWQRDVLQYILNLGPDHIFLPFPGRLHGKSTLGKLYDKYLSQLQEHSNATPREL